MAMEISTATYFACRLPESCSKKKSVKLRPPRSEARDSSDFIQEHSMDRKQSEIWQLFREAQQNILFLNKQRHLAAEALDKEKKEKELLLDKIEKMETDSRAISDKQTVLWELLHRIDAMVLIGMISVAEASSLRNAVVDFKSSIAEAFFDNVRKNDAELLNALRKFSNGSERPCFHIVQICTEMAPLISAGSLGAYVSGISKALQKRGHLIEVILPKFASLDLTKLQGLRKVKAEFYSYFDNQLHENAVWTGTVHGIGVTLIEPLHYSSFFSRENLYGYTDDFERFSYFSRACLDYLVKSGKRPDVLHIHNCETAIVGPLFWDIFVEQGLRGTRILLTCHGFDSQILVQPDKLKLSGLDPAGLHRSDRLQDDNKSHLANILKGGVVYSNKVMMVSATSSKDKTVNTLGQGLQSTLKIHKDKLLVAPYGIDDHEWDPSKDKLLASNYSSEDMMGKTKCKAELQKQLNLVQDSSTVLVVCKLSGSVHFDVGSLVAVVRNCAMNNTQFIFIGSKLSGNKLFESLERELKGDTVSFMSECDETLSHIIFGAADIFLCESYDDPESQFPIKALRYGAAPLALPSCLNRFSPLGYSDEETSKYMQFVNSSFGNMSLHDALDQIRNEPLKWERKIREGMSRDFSWDAQCVDIVVCAYESITKL